ncbi:MAG TPA: hypothetical protein VKU02_26780 [Gemmataceae bacterium]|nr:hypothetical protein [Gemmataceae bacterium]
MSVDLIKAILLNAAYEGAVAVLGPITDADGAKITPDPLIQDAGLRKKGLCVYEEAKVQYAALVRAFEDKTGIWPDPQVTPVTSPANPGTPSPPTSASNTLDIAGVAKGVSDVLSAVVPPPGKELSKS